MCLLFSLFTSKECIPALSVLLIQITLQNLHGGHLIDRSGYKKFKEMILDGVELNPEAKVAEDIYWAENEQRANIHVRPVSEHKTAGPQ